MQFKLISELNKKYSPIEQVLANRGIEEKEFNHYLNTTDADVSNPSDFGLDLLKQAATILMTTIHNDETMLVIVDADCDGFTSSAIILNYLYELFPYWVESKVDYVLHSGKQHGLADHIDSIVDKGYGLVLIPDAGTNDSEQCKRLQDKGTKVVILDHHLAEEEGNPYAVIINNQTTEYPNKALSGAGVVYQFCRYIDSLLGQDYADHYLDLCALGNMADVMSLKSIETKHLINKGFQPEYITNPFIYGMWEKNKFKLGEHITPMGAAFYIAPFVNAMVRSGTPEEKELLFSSMLKYKAFKELPSTKRGHALNEMERVVDQALRTCTNVKNRQGRAQDTGMEVLETRIETNNMLDHKVLLFLMKPGEIDPNIAGLIANKLASKYQRPCCILTRTMVQNEDRTESAVYQGSARGYERTGVSDFKKICFETGLTTFTIGHENAFGLGIREGDEAEFTKLTDAVLQDITSEPMYYVDYIFNASEFTEENCGEIILDIARHEELWGKDVDEPYIAIKGLKVNKDNIVMMKSNTVKIKAGIDIIRFRMSDEEYEKLNVEGFVEINAICRCNLNEWQGYISPQCFLEDYEIIDSAKYFF